ncbi:MAG: arylesterase [Gammaproteobacteria bacterium]|nr:arylesterase [Gammaproteobacteria bacterium]
MIRDFYTTVFKQLILQQSFIIALTNKRYAFNKLLQLIVITSLAAFSISANAKTTKIVMYGDSISAGYGMQLHQSWPYLLNEEFKNDNIDIQFINESISGETTGGGLSRLDEVLKRQALTKGDWLVIELGGNDGLRGFPVKTIKQNLSAMIEKTEFKGVNVALMQIQIPPNYGKRYTQMFSNIYPQLAKEYDVPLLPFFMEKIAINPDYMLNDNLHPNISAQVVIRDIMKPLILNLAD